LVVTNIVLLLSLLSPVQLLAQNQDEDSFVEQLLARMTVEEKVGQLFLVTFVGNDLSEGSDIVELVTQYHVGGVVLLASNENFTNNEDTPRQVAHCHTDARPDRTVHPPVRCRGSRRGRLSLHAHHWWGNSPAQ